MQAILNIAVRAARQAGAYILRERDRLDTRAPGNKIITLQGQAETLIREAVEKAYPEHLVLATQSDMPESLPETVWYVEVVSGFENLVRNLPSYAIVITIEENKKPKHCLIFAPATDEIFTGTVGEGAQCNDYKMRIAEQTHLNNAVIATSNLQAGQLKHPDVLQQMNMESVAFYNQGCSALSLAYVAAGRIDAFFGGALSQTVLNAGTILIKESGGLISDLQGGLEYQQKGELVAANAKLFKKLLPLIKT